MAWLRRQLSESSFPNAEWSDGARAFELCQVEPSNRRGIGLGFTYTVTKGDEDGDGFSIGANALSLNGGTIRDTAGNNAVLTHESLTGGPEYIVDGVPPEITSVVITSDPGEDDTYAVGDVVEVTVMFSDTVELRGNRTSNFVFVPRLKLDVGGEARMANYSRRSSILHGDNSEGYLVFAYTVQDGDNDDNGIAIGTNALQLIGAQLYDGAGPSPGSSNKAEIEHEGLADDSEHKVVTTDGETDTGESTTPKSGLLTIKGSLRVGETLTADTSDLTDEDGLDFATFSHLWVTHADGASEQASIYSSPSYIVNASDEGKGISVRVLFYDDNGNAEVRISAVTDPVQSASASNSSATGAPTISGTVQVDETLTVDTSGIADADRLDNATFGYQWIRNDGSTDTEIADATGSSYVLSSYDLGKSIKVRVDFTDDADHQESLTSQPVGPVDYQVNQQQTDSPATGQPTITGTARIGETLTASVAGIADLDGLAGATFAYQWVANNGTEDADIHGATNSTYTLVATDAGKTIKVRVSFTDDGGTEESLVSAATAEVSVPLTANFEGVPAEHDGLSVFTFRVRFDPEPRVSYKVLRDESFQVTGGAVRRARRVNGSNSLREIHVEPSGYGDVTITLAGGRACGTHGAICTADGKVLSNTLTATVQGTPVSFGGGRAGARRRRRDRRLRGDLEPGAVGNGDGGLRHLGRQRHSGPGLYRHQWHADLRGGRKDPDHFGAAARRLPRRGPGDFHPDSVQPFGRLDQGRRGDRHHRKQRSFAQGVDGQVRAQRRHPRARRPGTAPGHPIAVLRAIGRSPVGWGPWTSRRRYSVWRRTETSGTRPPPTPPGAT